MLSAPFAAAHLSVMTDRLRILADNLAAVRDQIEEAAATAGRSSDDIRLVAVTKYVDAAVARDLFQVGCAELGESRPQSLWDKAEQLPQQEIHWHLIGHLQRNKVRRSLPHLALLHSIDSLRLLEEVASQAAALDIRVPALLEVNISGEPEKHGFAPEDLESLLPRIASFEQVSIQGLMAMARRDGGPDLARRDFAAVRELRDELQTTAPDNISLDELSIGMSRDFTEAIQEGATIVRIGRALYEGLDT